MRNIVELYASSKNDAGYSEYEKGIIHKFADKAGFKRGNSYFQA